MLKKIVSGAAVVTALSSVGATAAQAQYLKMPFPCGTSVLGQARADHSPRNAIDFNGPGGGDTDLGDPVVAAGDGIVTVSTYYTSNGYGNAIEVDHGGGKSTFYAHLQNRLVAVGTTVKQGQLIAHVGKTSAKYTFSAHLHYEQRENGSAIEARFSGALADPYKHWESAVAMKSDNCGAGGGGTQQPPSSSGGAGVKLPATSFRFNASIGTDNGLEVAGRRGPKTTAEVVRKLASGTAVKIVCQTRGQQVSGKYGTSRIWDLIDLGNGRGAYVTDTYVYTGKDGRVAPAC